MTNPENRARMAAERRTRGRGSRVVGNGDDEKVEEEGEGEQRQECDLERQPLLVAREDRVRQRWTLSGFLEVFSFNCGTTSL